MTQKERILDYLKQGKSITSRKAFYFFGCTRLSARIWDLRKDGYNIIGKTETGVNRFGEKVSYESYTLVDGNEG